MTRRASDSLHLSQPALSEALGKLERELGVTLLDRRRSGARISRQGQDLLPYMTEVLDAVDRLRQAAGDQTLVSRNLRVGTVNAANSSLLVPAVQDFRRSHPSGQITTRMIPASRLWNFWPGLRKHSCTRCLECGGMNVPPMHLCWESRLRVLKVLLESSGPIAKIRIHLTNFFETAPSSRVTRRSALPEPALLFLHLNFDFFGCLARSRDSKRAPADAGSIIHGRMNLGAPFSHRSATGRGHAPFSR